MENLENRRARNLALLREDSSHVLSFGDPRILVRSQAKSLFRKILPVTPCGSRFCTDQAHAPGHKSLRMNILKG
jgi:hypothetical protein